MLIYEADIETVGAAVAEFISENMLITFYHGGPADCLEYAVVLATRYQDEKAALAVNQVVHFAATDFPITAIGPNAQSSLFELAHLTLIFDGATTPLHNGAVHIAGKTPAIEQLTGSFEIRDIENDHR